MDLSRKRVLVTGASGFIASHLTCHLTSLGTTVAVTTKYDSIVDNVRLASLWDDLEVIECDLRNADSVAQIRRFKPDVIYHFAAYNHVGDSFIHITEAMDCNTKGTVNLIEGYQDFERFVYISTSEVYGFQKDVPFRESMQPFPTSPYAVGKYAGELYCRMKHHVTQLPIVVIRPFNAFGPYQSPRAVISELILKCLKGLPIETTEGKQTREFNFILNLVEAFELAATRDEAIGEVINVGAGEEIAIRDLVKLVHEMTESRSPLAIGKLPYRPTEIWRMYADNSKAKQLLGWQPQVDFREGLRRTIDWYRRFLSVFDTKGELASLLHSF